MCMCGKAVKNGEPGYSWDGKGSGVKPVNPPDLAETDKLLFDEPGRCGGMDSHSHHYRVVLAQWGGLALLVRHGGGDERIELGGHKDGMVSALTALDSNQRYWILSRMYNAQHYAAMAATDREGARWRQAAAEKRVKTRKMPGRDQVKVWIEDKLLEVA